MKKIQTSFLILLVNFTFQTLLVQSSMFKFMHKELDDKGFDNIENARITLHYYIQTLNEIQNQTNRKDKLKIYIHLPVLQFYLKNIDQINLDSVAHSYSIRFCKHLRSKYFQLFQRSTLFKFLNKSIFEEDNLKKWFTKSIETFRTKFENRFKMNWIQNEKSDFSFYNDLTDETEDESFDLS